MAWKCCLAWARSTIRSLTVYAGPMLLAHLGSANYSPHGSQLSRSDSGGELKAHARYSRPSQWWPNRSDRKGEGGQIPPAFSGALPHGFHAHIFFLRGEPLII